MVWKPFAGVGLMCLVGALSASPRVQKPAAQPLPGDEMIYKYLCAEADKLSGKFRDGAKTLEEWQKKRPRLHREYLDMLGLWPLPEKTPLKATITGQLESQGVIVDKLHFQAKPGLYVTANLYRPKTPSAQRLPAILYVCGHDNRGRDGNKSAYQEHGMWFASNGYICLILDSLELGEIKGQHHGTYGIREKKPAEVRWWWHSAGYTPAGVECWNGIRAIDYLVSRGDVDQDRIGVTGISGGGATTFWIAAADERVKVAVPVSGMSDFETYIKHKVINGHCDCMFLYNTYQWDWTTIAALIAPRPLLFANSDNDPIFPMDGNRRVMEKLRKVYTMYGKPDLVDEYVSRGGHAYRPDLRIAVFRFLNKHLKNDTTSLVKDTDFKTIAGKELRVFPTDDDIPKDALNGRIDETFVPRAKVELPGKGKFEEWKKDLWNQCKAMSLRTIPDPVPVAKQVRSFQGISEDYSSEPGLEFQGMVLRFNPEGKPTVTLVIMNSDDDLESVGHWNKRYPGERTIYAIYPRGSEKSRWTKQSPPNYVERSFALLGQTADTGRLRDVIAALKAFEGGLGGKAPVRVVGKGQAGVLAAYAALYVPTVKEVVIMDPPKSHKEGPYFLGVLRVLDIPETLGLLAPKPLTLINAKDAAFDRTAEIYQLAGAADKLTRK